MATEWLSDEERDAFLRDVLAYVEAHGQTAAARRFGLSQSYVSKIVRGRAGRVTRAATQRADAMVAAASLATVLGMVAALNREERAIVAALVEMMGDR